METLASRLVDNQTQTEVLCSTDFNTINDIQRTSRRPSNQEIYVFDQSSNRLYPKSALDNGNESDGQFYQRISSPEPVNENKLNGNSEPFRDCSDDDHLETLDRKVTEIINANRFMSPIDNGNSITPHG